MTNPTATASPSHVAVLAFPFGTHAAPLLAVIRHLATRSPDTHFSFLSTASSNAALFSSKTPPNLTRHDVPEPIMSGAMAMFKFLETAEEVFRQEVEEVENKVGKKVTCLVTDAFYGFAAEMGVKWVAFWTAGPAALTAHFHTDLIREKVGLVKGITLTGQEVDPLDFIPGMAKVRVKDLPAEVVAGDLDSIFPKTLHQMAIALPKASAVFINSFEALDMTITLDLKSKFQNYLNVGPLSLLLPPPPTADLNDCLPWLDKQRPHSVAYISFGTVTTPPPHELAAIAVALEESKTPFIWSLKDDSRLHLPEGFLTRTGEHGKIVPLAPQVEILAHYAVGIFVTHCGWNSVLEGLVSGVPMIGRPFFGDQHLNARVISSVLEIGMVVEGGVFTEKEFKESLELVLRGQKGLKMRSRAEKLKKAATEASRVEGSSHKDLKFLLEEVTKTN